RLIKGGGARVDDIAIGDEATIIAVEALVSGIKLSSGRKHHRLVRAR
ncbi:MAG: tyrosine--tRNA ligase, partial [Acetobacteraceae bacterium]|nr:tyrosine--tRNA ligase [Acetobacteraceae bacterium]